ncbi:hypothetical protein ATANTOWER_017648 [Ataeniobius toweri]|uniref:Uncharacterized protein n=1 Tax=Ataeniobius toweri TaxID=208326 RepID=A0ABU7BIT6_9TELE|nr:hypothetical protein [Ataeniobius toweri]
MNESDGDRSLLGLHSWQSHERWRRRASARCFNLTRRGRKMGQRKDKHVLDEWTWMDHATRPKLGGQASQLGNIQFSLSDKDGKQA